MQRRRKCCCNLLNNLIRRTGQMGSIAVRYHVIATYGVIPNFSFQIHWIFHTERDTPIAKRISVLSQIARNLIGSSSETKKY